MAKKKHPIFRLHKIKVHHNRWLIWAIAYVLFVAIAMVGYIKISDESVTSYQADQVFASWRTYQNSSLGFSVHYPATWAIESTDPATVTIGPQSSTGIEISLYKTTAEKTIRKPLDIVAERPITIDGVAGKQITNDLGNNNFETVVLVKNQGHIYVIRGSESDVNKILLTFNFIPIIK